jgi:hypothetical protein
MWLVWQDDRRRPGADLPAGVIRVTAPVPEDYDLPHEGSLQPPGEHEDELPTEGDGDQTAEPLQEENAETSLDQPSQ